MKETREKATLARKSWDKGFVLLVMLTFHILWDEKLNTHIYAHTRTRVRKHTHTRTGSAYNFWEWSSWTFYLPISTFFQTFFSSLSSAALPFHPWVTSRHSLRFFSSLRTVTIINSTHYFTFLSLCFFVVLHSSFHFTSNSPAPPFLVSGPLPLVSPPTPSLKHPLVKAKLSWWCF